MQLSTKGRYGLKAVYELAILKDNKTPVSLKHIAEQQDISENYLEQLMAQLKKGGLVRSHRGVNGGYNLTKEPKDITVGEVVRILEGPIGITECTGGIYTCDSADECVLRPLFMKVSEKMVEAFDSVTIEDLINDKI